MGAQLRHQVGRHFDVARRGDARGLLPAGDAADAPGVRHHEIAGAGVERLGHRLGAVEVLADLDRQCEFADERRVAGEVVVADRLLDPIDAFMGERPAAFERLRHRERLVVVDHDGDIVGEPPAHRAGDGEILRERRMAEPELDRLEAAGEELFRFIGGRLRRHQAEAAGIVGRDRPRRSRRAGSRAAAPPPPPARPTAPCRAPTTPCGPRR